eukprot:CAMPEP_0167740568 /NCGR_PEP_ID=MMETSP0110_2-20121227/356_1 /TAXON_ID=629695 /ORGANISM="Gymnochlora sp., Strain CCMP2014" /LENGTH=130 /DNA_ID=CAMNT_0007624489 /DNA_START=3401 /DNA_END=3793 /DNA_ORIENTATION=+
MNVLQVNDLEGKLKLKESQIDALTIDKAVITSSCLGKLDETQSVISTATVSSADSENRPPFADINNSDLKRRAVESQSKQPKSILQPKANIKRSSNRLFGRSKGSKKCNNGSVMSVFEAAANHIDVGENK